MGRCENTIGRYDPIKPAIAGSGIEKKRSEVKVRTCIRSQALVPRISVTKLIGTDDSINGQTIKMCNHTFIVGLFCHKADSKNSDKFS